MHVTAIIAAGGRGARFGGAEPEAAAVGRRPADSRAQRRRRFSSHPVDRRDRRRAAARISVGRPAGVPACGTGKPLRIVAGGARRQDSVANAFRGRRRATRRRRDSRRGAAVRERRPDRADDRRGGRVGRGARRGAVARHGEAHRSRGRSRRRPDVVRARRCRARRSISRRRRRRSGATCCARRSRSARATASRRPTRPRSPSAPATRCALVDGEPSNIKITTPDDMALARGDRRASIGNLAPGADRPRRHRLRPASSGRRPAADSRRRDDSVRARRARALRRRRRLPRGDRRDSRRRRRSATSAGIFPTPIRGGRTPTASICCARVVGARRATQGFEVGNVDVTVILERAEDSRPRRRDARRAGRGARHRRRRASASRARPTKGVDAVGRGEAIAAHAVALLQPAV